MMLHVLGHMTGGPPEPVEIQITRHHAYTKGTKGCRTCGRGKYAQEHLGHASSYNALGSGSKFVYQNMKKGWMDALGLALAESGLPKGLGRILVEGVSCFPDRRRRDQGNHRFLIEKALGDVLVRDGYIADDVWTAYSFGDFGYRYELGVSWTRLMLFPALSSQELAA